jgi:hypothetical protein
LDLPARGNGAKHASSPLLVAHHRAARRPAPRAGPAAANPGRPDGSFGTGGRVTTDFAPVFGDADEINTLVVQQGKLVAAGSSFTGGGLRFDFAVARYRPNGDLDESFRAGGTTTTDFTRRENRAQALVLQSGRPVAVGSAVNGSGKQTFALARYLS